MGSVKHQYFLQCGHLFHTTKENQIEYVTTRKIIAVICHYTFLWNRLVSGTWGSITTSRYYLYAASLPHVSYNLYAINTTQTTNCKMKKPKKDFVIGLLLPCICVREKRRKIIIKKFCWYQNDKESFLQVPRCLLIIILLLLRETYTGVQKSLPDI